MTTCCAILKTTYRSKIPMVQKCQQTAIVNVKGHMLCMTHLNALQRDDLMVVTKLEMLKDEN